MTVRWLLSGTRKLQHAFCMHMSDVLINVPVLHTHTGPPIPDARPLPGAEGRPVPGELRPPAARHHHLLRQAAAQQARLPAGLCVWEQPQAGVQEDHRHPRARLLRLVRPASCRDSLTRRVRFVSWSRSCFRVRLALCRCYCRGCC